MEDPIDRILADLKKLDAFDGYTEGSRGSTGNAGQRVSGPLSSRLAKNTDGANTQQLLEKIQNGEAVSATDEEIDRALERMADQIIKRVMG